MALRMVRHTTTVVSEYMVKAQCHPPPSTPQASRMQRLSSWWSRRCSGCFSACGCAGLRAAPLLADVVDDPALYVESASPGP